MSYRVDIPTLSANEVYTLTFEYEGTETIQLIVGDLTLETTDRRVVFTTTSPVNYIESNVNLTNLNMYEGYYESDDFGGEYTQESYIEGMSLVNLIQSEKHLDFQNRDCGVETFEDNMIKLTITNVSSLTSTWQHGWIKTSANLKVGATYTCVIHVVENSISTEGIKVGASYGTLVHGSASNSLGGGETGVIVFTYTTATKTLKDYNGYYDGFCAVNHVGAWQNGSLKYGIMVFEGDYYDYFINNNIPYFEGIGCVKSPKIVSHKAKNLVPTFKIISEYGSNVKIEVFDDNKHIEFTHTGNDARLQFQFDVASIGLTSGDLLGIEFDAMTKGVGTVANKTSAHLMFTNIRNIDDKTNISYFETGHYKNVVEIVGNSIQIHFRQNVGGANGNEYFIVKNFSVFKINSVDDMKDDYEEGVVSTPDDLELYCNHHYDRTTKISSPCHQDTLDLTTGTVTRKNIKARLNDYIAKYGSVQGSLVSVNGGDMVRVKYNHNNSSTNIFPVQIDGEVTGLSVTGIAFTASQGGYEGTWFTTGDIEHAYADVNSVFMFFNPSRFNGIDYTDLTTIKNWLIEQDFTLIIKIQNASVYTEQLPTSLNPLKSYRNGSIQTSSQQLTPTLKTTLPISNKFTTTNLTSGSTYNIYFDGTATKLDAGGTIITDPVSPCEVECGGTTLTIEGTDIQNVRVIETTVKNEVGSVCGTTDVELSRIKTYKYENILDGVQYKTSVWNGAVININYDDFCIEFTGAHGWAGEFADTGLKYPTGCSLVHVEFDIDMDNPNLRMAINFNEGIYNSYPQHRHVTLNNDTATIAQGNYENIYTSIITKGHFSRLMYANGDRPIIINLYTGSYIAGILATGNSAEGSIDGYETIGSNYGRITNLKMRIIENFSSNYTTVTSVLRDSSYNIIWQDMDMTIPQTISKLEQPIKLRSLGTTYDSYNPVTGELIKRIRVSETDGSYSVLSSPVISQAPFGRYFTNIFDINTDMIRNWSTTPTVNGNEITIKGTWYTSFGVPFEKGKQYTLFYEMVTDGRIIVLNNHKNQDSGIIATNNNNWSSAGTKDVLTFTYEDDDTSTTGGLLFFASSTGTTYKNIMVVEGKYSYDDLPYFEGTQFIKCDIPQLYTNGQVKVYSESDVYPTTILNGQSTNNYEVNELNTSNSYTIRYEGECESIILAKKSNTQGTNRIVKAGATSGNLTFVNDSGDIDNVLLVQNDVREQEINHFNGLQTVEVSGMLIENQGNMWWNDWIAPSEYGASWQVDSPEFISVQPGETIYVVANNNNYTSLLEFDENYNIVNQGKDLILSNEANPKPVNLGNNYYKNYRVLSENTRYIKFTIPVGTATTAKNEARWSVISFTKTDVGNVPLYTNNTPYRGSIINLPQPVQLNSLPDGTCDTYNPITGEYVQNVGIAIMDENGAYGSSWSNAGTAYPVSRCTGFAIGDMASTKNTVANVLNNMQTGGGHGTAKDYEIKLHSYGNSNTNYRPIIDCGNLLTGGKNNIDGLKAYLKENPIILYYQLVTPTITQLTPINIPTFEGGIVQLITTDGKVFPMVEYSMPTNNRYDTSSWETGAVYTQRNMTEAYFNESTTPMTPTETTTLTTDHISSGSIILNDNGNGLIVLKGNYTGRDIPYFTGMRSVEAIEVETTPSPDQPLFGKGGRK